MRVVHAAAVVAEVAQFRSDAVGLCHLPHQVAQGINHLAGTLGVVAQHMPPFLEPGLCRSRAFAERGVGGSAQMLSRVPEVDQDHVGLQRFQKCPVVLRSVSNGCKLQIRLARDPVGNFSLQLRLETLLASLRETPEVPAFQHVSLVINQCDDAA